MKHNIKRSDVPLARETTGALPPSQSVTALIASQAPARDMSDESSRQLATGALTHPRPAAELMGSGPIVAQSDVAPTAAWAGRNFSLYALMGVEDAKYKEHSFAEYRESIALLSHVDLRRHAVGMNVPIGEDISALRDCLERKFLQFHPDQLPEAAKLMAEIRGNPESLSLDEQVTRLLGFGADPREAWARARRKSREDSLSLQGKGELAVSRGAG